MIKKVVAMIMAGVISLSVVSCGSSKEEKESVSNNASIEDNYDKLEGEWAKDVTLQDFSDKYSKLLDSVKKQTEDFGLTYEEKEEAKDQTKKYIYVENKDAEENRLELFSFGETLFDDVSKGQITMKVSLKINGDKVKEDGKYDLGSTCISKYSALFTGEKDRDFSELDDKIVEALNTEKGEGVIQSDIDGLYEEITVTKEYIVYKLETKKFTFVSAADSNK